jgi:hypothetical protein
MSDLKQEITLYNGIRDLYVSLYPSNFLVNKVFFDLDYGDSVLSDAKKIFEYITVTKHHQAIPVVSGKKGYHIYYIVKPEIHKQESRIRLLRAHYSIIKDVFGSFKQKMVKVNNKTVSVFIAKKRIIAPDPQVCGDIRRISRLPNTLRPPENINYCTYLPPDQFLDMTEDDIAYHMKAKHTYNIKIDYHIAPHLTDFTYDFKDDIPEETYHNPIKAENTTFPTKEIYIKELFRPCIYRHISSIHPIDDIRFCSTLDLLSIGVSSDNIISIYSAFGWEDFVLEKTVRRVKGLEKAYQSGKYKPWSCKKLIAKGYPRRCCYE